MSGLAPMADPVTAEMILALIQTLERTQLAASAATAPAITGPLGLRIFSASSPAQVLAAIPNGPRRNSSPLSF